MKVLNRESLNCYGFVKFAVYFKLLVGKLRKWGLAATKFATSHSVGAGQEVHVEEAAGGVKKMERFQNAKCKNTGKQYSEEHTSPKLWVLLIICSCPGRATDQIPRTEN